MTTISPPRFPGLDSLRAVASVAVVATHTCFWAGAYSQGVLGAATQRLEIGVALFFVLSGFLLSYPYLAARRTGREADRPGRYLFKRALRILPVYWLVVVVALVAIPENDGLGARRWLDSFFLVDIYRAGILPNGLTQMWSLSTEATFYLLLPVLMAILIGLTCRQRWRPNRLLAALLVLGLVSLVWSGTTASGDLALESWARRGLIGYLLWFAVGIAFAVLHISRTRDERPGRVLRWIDALAATPGTCWVAAIAIFVVSSTPIAGPTDLAALSPSDSVVRSLLYAVSAGLVILPSIFGDPRTTYARVLAHPLPRHLGQTSYSLFCCHMIVLELVAKNWNFPLFQSNPWHLFAVVLGVSLVVAELLYRLVEKPFLRLKDIGRRTPDPTKSPRPSVTRT